MAVVGDLAIASAMWLWLAKGSSGAENICLFSLWSIAVCRVLVGLLGDQTWFERNKRPAGFEPYHVTTDALLVGVLAYFGFFALAGCLLVGHFFIEAARCREPKKKEDA